MDCTIDKCADIARAVWPSKTAENWAYAAGVQPRMAKYWLADPATISPAARLALIPYILGFDRRDRSSDREKVMGATTATGIACPATAP